MRKRPSIASEYLVSVSHQCIASVPTFETSNPSVLLHIRPFLAGWKRLPQHPLASMSLVNVARDVGRMRQYEHLTGAGSPQLFYVSHNLSVEMGDFTDKLFILNNLSVRTCLFTDKPVIWSQPLSGLCASVRKQVDSQEHI